MQNSVPVSLVGSGGLTPKAGELTKSGQFDETSGLIDPNGLSSKTGKSNLPGEDINSGTSKGSPINKKKQKNEQLLLEQLQKTLPKGLNYDKISNFILHGCKCENVASDVVKHYLTPMCEESVIYNYIKPTCQEEELYNYLLASCEEQELINKYIKPSCETCKGITEMIKTFVHKGRNVNNIKNITENEVKMYKNKNTINGFSNIELNNEDYINPTIYHPKISQYEHFENLANSDFDIEYKYYKSNFDEINNNYAKFARENFNINMGINTNNNDKEQHSSSSKKEIENFEIDTSKLGNSPTQIIGIGQIKSNKLYYGLPCDYLKDDSFYNALKQEGFKMTNNATNACLIVPCSYENTENEIEQLEKMLVDNTYGKSVRVFMLNNTDFMVSKLALWKFLKDRYGSKIASTMIPYSVDLTDKKELEDFKKNFDKTKLYITKNNNQRQEGIEIHNNLNTIMNSLNKYILVQELLQDPYLINGRKINLRVYCLIIRDTKSNTLVQIYQDGFMYYTAELFEKGNASFKKNITTGYIDRKVYEENPLTHEDFKKYLDNTERKLTPVEEYYMKTRPNVKLSNYVFTQINHLLKFILETYISTVGTKTLGVGFQIYGADIAINEHLKPMIMEINKGPDLTAKDGRDKLLKESMCKDVLKSVGLITPNINNKFLTVLEVVNMNNELVEFNNYSQ